MNPVFLTTQKFLFIKEGIYQKGTRGHFTSKGPNLISKKIDSAWPLKKEINDVNKNNTDAEAEDSSVNFLAQELSTRATETTLGLSSGVKVSLKQAYFIYTIYPNGVGVGLIKSTLFSWKNAVGGLTFLDSS